MAQLINEAKRFQQLAGILNEANEQPWEEITLKDGDLYYNPQKRATYELLKVNPDGNKVSLKIHSLAKDMQVDENINIFKKDIHDNKLFKVTEIITPENSGLNHSKWEQFKDKSSISEAELSMAGHFKVGDKFKMRGQSNIRTIKKIEGNKLFIEDENIPGRLFQWDANGIDAEIKTGKLKLLTPVEEAQLNEDILELKQMSKQLYSFLKNKGFLPSLRSQLQTEKTKEIGEGENAVQIAVTDKPDERVMVAITAPAVAKAIVGGGDDWNTKATEKFGQNITGTGVRAHGNWFTNPEITKYVDNLGNEILKQIFEKYPNMVYGFSQRDNFWYILEFKFKETAKGGTANPNQRPNAAKPAEAPVAESLDIDSIVNEALKAFRKENK